MHYGLFGDWPQKQHRTPVKVNSITSAAGAPTIAEVLHSDLCRVNVQAWRKRPNLVSQPGASPVGVPVNERLANVGQRVAAQAKAPCDQFEWLIQFLNDLEPIAAAQV